MWAFDADPVADVFPILNACVATVTAGWCPTPARLTGAGTAPPDCCCGRRGPTDRPRCCCSTGRRGAIRAAPGALPGGARDSHETAEQAAVREAHEEAGLTADQLTVRDDRGDRRGLGRAAGRTGPTPPSSPTRPSCSRPCPTGRAPNCAGWPRTRWPTCRCIPGSPPAGQRLRAGRRRRSRCWSTALVSSVLQPVRRGLRIVGRGDRAHHDDAARAGVEHLGQALLVDAADREPRLVRALIRPPPGPGPGRARAGPAWSASASTARRRSSRPASVDRARRPGRASWVDRPISGRGPTMSRAIASGRSSWPEVQHVGAGRPGDVGAVVDRQQRAVPCAPRRRAPPARRARRGPPAARTAARRASPCRAAG